MKTPDYRYTIADPVAGVRKITWWGPFESRQPASDAELIARETGDWDEELEGNYRVELDLTHCQSFDTRGIAMLVYLRRRYLQYRTSWSIVGAPELLKNSLNLLNLNRAFPFRTRSAIPGSAFTGNRAEGSGEGKNGQVILVAERPSSADDHSQGTNPEPTT